MQCACDALIYSLFWTFKKMILSLLGLSFDIFYVSKANPNFRFGFLVKKVSCSFFFKPGGKLTRYTCWS